MTHTYHTHTRSQTTLTSHDDLRYS